MQNHRTPKPTPRSCDSPARRRRYKSTGLQLKPALQAEILAALAAGETILAISKRFHVARSTVTGLLSSRGIEMADRVESSTRQAYAISRAAGEILLKRLDKMPDKALAILWGIASDKVDRAMGRATSVILHKRETAADPQELRRQLEALITDMPSANPLENPNGPESQRIYHLLPASGPSNGSA